MCELEDSASRGEELGQRERLLLRVEAAQRVRQDAPARDTHRDAVRLLQVANEARIEVERLELCTLGELLRRGLHIREVVHLALDEIAHLFVREVRAIHRAGVVPLAQPRRQVVRRHARGLVGLVEREHGATRSGTGGRHLAHVHGGDVLLLEDRVREGLGEIRDEACVLVRGERVDVDAEALRELDEQRRGERSPVALDRVEIARRDAEPRGHLDLREVLAPAQRPHLGPEPGHLRLAVRASLDDRCPLMTDPRS